METDRNNQVSSNPSDTDSQASQTAATRGGGGPSPELPTTPDDENGEKSSNGNTLRSDLLQLYKQWIDVYDHRSVLYLARIDAAWKNLELDINRWEEPLSRDEPNRLVHHHVVQFKSFIKKAFEALTEESQPGTPSDPLVTTEAADFRALLVGVFTAQWMLLQSVIFQRLAGSPYRDDVGTLDAQATAYYARLYNTFDKNRLNENKLNKKYRKYLLAPSAPLIHLGKTAQITIFNRRVPLMLSVPLSALENRPGNENSRMSIPHEIAHAIFAQIPELIDEIKGKLKAQIEENESSRREQVLNFFAINWTEEVCADLIGTALAGEAFARSARWIMADSDQTVGITDLSHPPALLRPMIHLHALSILEPTTGEYAQTRQEFEEAVKQSPSQLQVGPTLHRRFRSVPALMFVRMDTMSDILERLVERILTLKLDILYGETMTTLLLAIHQEKRTQLPTGDPEKWGESTDITADELVLDFPAGFSPDHMTPGVTTHPDCCDSWILRPLCCSAA